MQRVRIVNYIVGGQFTMFRYILAMSQRDSKIRDSLTDLSVPMMEHIVKLMLYPDTDYCQGWRTEVYKFVNKVDKRKATNKYPEYSFIMNCFKTHYDVLDNYADQVKSDMQFDGCTVVPKHFTTPEIVKVVDDYCQWLATKLSTAGKVTNQEVHSYLAELGL